MPPAPKRNTRGAIAAAAQVEFSALGFSGARVDRIAKAAGVNKQLVFYYFGSKADLHRSVISSAYDELVGALSAIGGGGKPSPHRLRDVFSALCDTLAERPHLVRLLFVRQTGDDARDVADAAMGACAALLAQLISSGQGLGYYRDDADPETVARHAVVLAVGYVWLEGAGAADAARADWMLSVADLLSHGLAW